MTIQKILERAGFSSRYDRWLAIEKRLAEQPIDLTAEQIAFIEKQNPQFRERHVESSKPGELELLNQDTFLVISFKRVGRVVYMHVVIDGREFCGTDKHPYELYLELNDVKRRRTRVRRPQTNGFVERFKRTMLDEFFRIKIREKVYSSLESLQTDFDKWLQFYNEQRPHLGYRHHGKSPWSKCSISKYC